MNRSSTRSRTRAALFAAVLALALAPALGGCGPDYDRTEINAQPSKLGGGVTKSRIEVPLGMVVKAHIVSYDDDEKVMKATFRVADPAILEVAGVVTDSDYAFLGLRPGITQVELRADGDLVLIVDAVVTEQPAAP